MEFAQALKSTFRSSDVIGRLGGDEFVVLLTNTKPAEIDKVIERLDDEITLMNREHEYQVAYSFGMTLFDPDLHRSIEDLLDASDKSMYLHKRQKGTSNY
jgi:diguanylate cyclase (GGDEF)-like protein